MSKKISIRISKDLYEKLNEEWQKYGYRSLSAYIVARLEKGTVIEIEGSRELAKALFQMIKTCQLNVCGRRRVECPSLNLLMTKIEELINCIKLLDM